jgi:Lon protease-like protein
VTASLPLFPLKTVLFPGGPLALRVFEPRYLDMVARCLRGANRFGVVAIRDGEEVGAVTMHELGTAAEIVDWHQEEGGMLGIMAIGRQRFRLAAPSRQPDGLYVAEVEWLPSEPPLPLPPEHAPLAALLQRLLGPTRGDIAARSRGEAVAARGAGRSDAAGPSGQRAREGPRRSLSPRGAASW